MKYERKFGGRREREGEGDDANFQVEELGVRLA